MAWPVQGLPKSFGRGNDAPGRGLGPQGVLLLLEGLINNRIFLCVARQWPAPEQGVEDELQ